MVNKPQQSKMAITSLVLGALSLLFSILTGIPAIVFGIIALVKIKKSGCLLKGKGFAVTGIILSVVLIITQFVLTELMLCQTQVYAKVIQQKAQFHSIDVGLEVFKSEFGIYPESNDNSVKEDNHDPIPYCGANKLAEAMMGQDGLGFHPDSEFQSNGMDDSGKALYAPETSDIRKGPYIDPEIANVYRLKDIFEDVGDLDGNSLVICDVYEKKRHSGKKTGMPILYYRARTKFSLQDSTDTNANTDDIYNFQDNTNLLALNSPEDNTTKHPLYDGESDLLDFENIIINEQIKKESGYNRPYRADSYILMSAGPDGLYGTSDDIVNFYKENEIY